MKINKSILSVFGILVLIISLLPTAQAADSESSSDQVWLNHVYNYATLISKDLDDLSSSWSTYDLVLMQTAGTNLQNHCNDALTENSNIAIPDVYKETNDEWVAGLSDIALAGQCFQQFAIDAQNGYMNYMALIYGVYYLEFGSIHIDSASKLLQ
jgi:hypothetical protein